jgi:tryptophan-rich sensory protein
MFLKSLLTTGLLTTAAATVGSLATGDAPNSRWYRRLRKPAYQPPSSVFPVVWTALYADIALTSAAAMSDRSPTKKTDAAPTAPQESSGYLPALVVNLILNAGWSVVFFRMRNLQLAVVVAVALAASSADLARRAGQVKPTLGWVLSPYAAWCTFAAVLSNRIRALNR